MAPTFDTGLILRLYDWSETSQIVVALTKGHGLVRAVAKGSRRPTAKFSGGIELMTVGQLGLIAKPEQELAQCTEWDLTDPVWHLRTSLAAFYGSMLMADVLMAVVIDRDPHPALFEASLRALAALRDANSADAAVVTLVWLALCEGGYQPEVGATVRGEALPQTEKGLLVFDPALGGVVGAATPEHLASAAQAQRSGEPARLWPVRMATLEALGTLDARVQSAGRGAGTDGPSRTFDLGWADGLTTEDVRRCGRLLISHLEYQVGRPLPAREGFYPELVSQISAHNSGRATAGNSRS